MNEEGRSVWRGRTALVTGCTGFLGEAVTRELVRQGATVVAFLENRSAAPILSHEHVSGQLRPVYGRIEDTCRLYSALAVHEVSVIFHLADHSGAPKAGRPHTNAERDDCSAAAAVLRAAALRHSRLPVVAVRPVEHVRLVGAEPGGTTPHGIVRFGEMFGEGDRRLSRCVPRMVAALLNGERVFAADDARRDFVHVRDAARACLTVAEAIGMGEARVDAAFRSGWHYCETEMLELLLDSLAGRRPVHAGEPAADNPFGWRPRVALADALRDAIAWHRGLAAASRAAPPPKHTLRKAA